jgi:signal peptidase II
MKLKYLVYAVAAPIIIVFDQWTKLLVLDRFQYGESLSILPGFFSLTYIRNTGAAFGMLADAHESFRVPFFLLVPLIALLFLLYLLRDLEAQNRIKSLALGLVTGGAIGNLIDRIRLGYVVDFMDFHWKDVYHYPAFNVADAAICVGVVLLLLPDAKTKKGKA